MWTKYISLQYLIKRRLPIYLPQETHKCCAIDFLYADLLSLTLNKFTLGILYKNRLKRDDQKFWKFAKKICWARINKKSFLAIYNWYNLEKLFSYSYNMLFVSNCIVTIKGKARNFFILILEVEFNLCKKYHHGNSQESILVCFRDTYTHSFLALIFLKRELIQFGYIQSILLFLSVWTFKRKLKMLWLRKKLCFSLSRYTRYS